ncbi:CocE/NonD family hydrolase, partial [Steroidobacter sp.]|uniref:CocE/NonD family hydrolase n=1 Tax=Steroidobacter sp. TaxID=1978227 RepID=UPI001A5769ED
MKQLIAIVMAVACATAAGNVFADEARRRAVDVIFQSYEQPGTPGVSVGVYHRGRVDVLAGYGMADLEQGVRITPKTRFHVASVSKQFAAYAVALLERDGRLKVTDDVRRWLPYVPDFGRPMQIQHLIHHTNGLRDQWALFQLGGLDYSGVLYQQQVVSIVARQRGLNFPVGTEHSYTNTGYTLLAEIVKEASGKSFRSFTDERIFKPLGMNRSFFVDDLTEVIPERAHSYANYSGKRWQREPLNFETYGATSLLTTAEDLLKWTGNLARPVVGDADLNKQIMTLGKLDDGATINYAYGLRREPFAGHMAMVHTGHDAGFNSVFAYFPDSDFAVVLLANQPARLFAHLEALVRLYIGEGREPAPGNSPPSVSPSPQLLQELQGHYIADYGALVSLDLIKGELIWNARSASDDRPGQKLIFRTDGTFDIGGRTRGFNFYRVRRDSAGRVDGFDRISNVGGQKVMPYRQAVPAKPTAAQVQEFAGDYYSAEVDATYSFSVEDGALTARSIWLKAPIRFTPSVADRFDSGEGLLPTLIFERDADGKPQRVRIQDEYVRNMVLERRPDNLEQIGKQAGEYLRRHYTRHEFDIPMRDGVNLFTVAYVPRDETQKHGILLERTPYGIGVRGETKFLTPIGGPLFHYARENFIFVYQDVRGRYNSGGEFMHVRPYRVGKRAKEIDESTDSYDTIDWLVKKLPNNNGRACMLGISYAGFYSALGAIDAHPALKCVSPQAPAIDWYMGDDFRRNGAFALLHAWRFFTGFDAEPPRPVTDDAYSYFLRAGSLSTLSGGDFKERDPFWKQLVAHDAYDEFWQSRDLRRHVGKPRPAVLTVGGWFDAENLHGPLNFYRTLQRNGATSNSLVMGPWAHGEWSWTDGSRL